MYTLFKIKNTRILTIAFNHNNFIVFDNLRTCTLSTQSREQVENETMQFASRKKLKLILITIEIKKKYFKLALTCKLCVPGFFYRLNQSQNG
jgi:hypothetical protein